MRRNIWAIETTDDVRGRPGYVFVSAFGSSVGIGVSESENGDAELFLDIKTTQELVEALQRAIQEAVPESGS